MHFTGLIAVNLTVIFAPPPPRMYTARSWRNRYIFWCHDVLTTKGFHFDGATRWIVRHIHFNSDACGISFLHPCRMCILLRIYFNIELYGNKVWLRFISPRKNCFGFKLCTLFCFHHLTKTKIRARGLFIVIFSKQSARWHSYALWIMLSRLPATSAAFWPFGGKYYEFSDRSLGVACLNGRKERLIIVTQNAFFSRIDSPIQSRKIWKQVLFNYFSPLLHSVNVRCNIVKKPTLPIPRKEKASALCPPSASN